MLLSAGEPLEDFQARLAEKGSSIGKSEMEILNKFISCLPEQLAFFVRAGNPKDCATAVEAAKLGEAYGYRDHPPSISSIFPQPNHQKPAQPNSDIEELKLQVAQLTDIVTKTFTDRGACSSTGSSVATSRSNPTPRLTCFRCQIWTPCSILFNPHGKLSTPGEHQARLPGLLENHGARHRSPSPVRWESNNFSDVDSSDSSSDVPPPVTDLNKQDFMYLPSKFGSIEVAALIDTGSSINVMSRTLFNSIPDKYKSKLNTVGNSKIVLANNQTIDIDGTASVKMCVAHGKHAVNIHVISDTSHPLILGVDYLVAQGISIDFCKFSLQSNQSSKVKCAKRCVIAPNSECRIWAHVTDQLYGVQGVCTGSSAICRSGLLIARSVVTVSANKKIPIQILNPSNDYVTVPKGKILGEFCILDHNIDVVTDVDTPSISKHCVQNIQTKDAMSSPAEHVENSETVDSLFDISENLSSQERCELLALLNKHKQIFVTPENPLLGYTDLVKHKIELKPNAVSKHQKPYRLCPEKREVLRHQLDELLSQGVIAPVSESEDLLITSPIVLVLKRCQQPSRAQAQSNKHQSLSQYRFCCDFRHLNSQTQEFRYTIPNLQELTESFAERVPNFITSIDLCSGFFQMGIEPTSQRYTAFNTCFGTYKFLRLPMGLATAPNTFQLLMDKVLHGLKFRSCLCYLDDILIFSETFTEHLSNIEEVLIRLENAGLKLGPKKCSFAQQSCTYLGHLISRDGILPPPDRVKAIVEFPSPRNVKELRRIIGMMNWFRKFIRNFSSVVLPLTKLLKKGQKFIWTSEQDHAFCELKNRLANSTVLAFPRYDIPFRLAVDTSSRGIGYMLYQLHPNLEPTDNTSPNANIRVVRFGSKSLSRWQQSYGPTKLELLGMVSSILECADYLRGRKFVVECDHQALKPLFQKKLRGAIYERWLAILQQFSFDLEYKPASQMTVADALSRCSPPGQDVSSPNEDDPFFPYVPETTGDISLPTGQNIADLLKRSDSDSDTFPVQCIQVCPLSVEDDQGYDGDTDDIRDNLLVCRQKKCRLQTGKCFHRNSRSLRSSCAQTETFDASCLPSSASISSSVSPLLLETPAEDKTVVVPQDLLVSNVCSDVNDLEICASSCELLLLQAMNLQTVDSSCPVDSHVVDIPTESEDCVDILLCDINATGPESSGVLVTDSDVNHNVLSNEQTDTVSDKQPQSVSYEQLDELINSDFTPAILKTLQSCDDAFSVVYSYLDTGILPTSQKLARRVLLESSDYVLVDGVLYHSRSPKSKRNRDLNSYQVVLPQALVKTVLEICHNSPMGGHSGIQQTIDLVRSNYYFPRLAQTVSDYVKSCHECQSRKVTKVHTKSSVTAYQTPAAPFNVWQIDLFGPVPHSATGNCYIFTAVDMFSKYVFVRAIPNKDAMTVSECLFQLFTQFGVCDSLISDQGSEFISKCTREVCRLLEIPQQFTPAFVHHCLGTCERTHRTLAERITPYVTQGKNWEDVLPAVIFSMNNSVSASSKYTPFEIVFGHRPKFPLSKHLSDTNFSDLPVDCRSYIGQHAKRLTVIRQTVQENMCSAQIQMTERANADAYPLDVSNGDYVYMQKQITGVGRKFQSKYSGPYIVTAISSPHMVILLDPETGKCLPQPVHMDRLKMAYVRQPNPTNYFMDNVTAKHNCEDILIPQTVSDNVPMDKYFIETEVDSPFELSEAYCVPTEVDTPHTNDKLIINNAIDCFSSSDCVPMPKNTKVSPLPEHACTKRTRQKPLRFRDSYHFNPGSLFSSSLSSDDHGFHRVKRILAQKNVSVNLIGWRGVVWGKKVLFFRKNAVLKQRDQFEFTYYSLRRLFVGIELIIKN
ncbi:hypothetical protein ScPMuIL_003522 [Solemya velum]